MAIPLTQSAVVTSIKLFVTAANSQRHEIGQLTHLNPHETRTITDSFVIGNNPPDVPFELIPGVVTTRSLDARYVSLYVLPAQQAFARDDQNVVASLSDQNTPFDIQVTLQNPNTGQTKTLTYQGCYISDYNATRDIAGGDIRILENVTIIYRTTSSTTFQ